MASSSGSAGGRADVVGVGMMMVALEMMAALALAAIVVTRTTAACIRGGEWRRLDAPSHALGSSALHCSISSQPSMDVLWAVRMAVMDLLIGVEIVVPWRKRLWLVGGSLHSNRHTRK